MASASVSGFGYARPPLSTPGQALGARSTLTAVTYIPGRDKRLVFVTEWIFKPEGIRAVKVRFQEALKLNDLTANHEWDGEDNVFRVRCIVGDTPIISTIFFSILFDIISESHGDEYVSDEDDDGDMMPTNSHSEEEIFTSDMIERLSVWKKRHGIAEPRPKLEDAIAAINAKHQPAAEIVESPTKVTSKEAELVWECKDTRRNLDDIASDDILSALRDLSGCEFIKDLKTGKIFVGHSSVQSCQRAITKLDNLKKYSEPRNPYVNHLFYTEDVQKFQLRLCRFTDIQKRFFRTTLIHPYKMDPTAYASKLVTALSIRCAPWNELKNSYIPIRVGTIVPSTKDLGLVSKSRDHTTFKYREKGGPNDNPMRHLKNDEEIQNQTKEVRPGMGPGLVPGTEEHNKHLRIGAWAQQTAYDTLGDIFGEAIGMSGYPSSNPLSFQSNPDIDRMSYWRKNHKFGHSNIGKENTDQSNGSTAAATFASRLIGGPQVPTSRFADTYLGPAPKTNFQDELRRSQNIESSPTHSSVQRPHMPSLLDEDMPKLDFTPLQPSRKSSISVSSGSMTPMVSRSSSPLKLITTAKNPSSNQSPCSPIYSIPRDRRRMARKSDTTIDPTAMTVIDENQRADQPHQGTEMLIPSNNVHKVLGTMPHAAFDPTPAFFKEINSSFSKLVTGLQGFPGEVVIRAELGRIILRKANRRFIAVEDDPESFPSQELLNQLLPNPQKTGKPVRTLFTNVLTTLPTDIDYIVDMKNRAGELMWEQNTKDLSITYEISCHSERVLPWSRFSIEIDGDTFDMRIKTRYNFGSINVHGTQRHWDFRIVAFGFGDNELNEGLYGDFARAIQRSLHIPPNLSKPSLYFELNESFFDDSRLVIDSILVHHTTKYKGVGREENSILSISQIKALDVDCRYPFPGADFQIYKASSPPDDQNEAENLHSWHEASISSFKADEQLKQNKTLELGDEATWTPETLEKMGTAKSLYLPACEMVKQMDGIGYHNDNGINPQEFQSFMKGNQTPSPQAYQWW